MPDLKKPPLAKAAREFLAGVQLPPPPKHGPNPNTDSALLLHAMMWHAREVRADAKFVKCSPSLKQLAKLMFCSVRTVQRVMQALHSIGIITSQRRGDGLSNHFIVYQKPHSDTTTVVHSEMGFRHVNSVVQTGQLGRSDTTTRISDTTTPVSDATTVVHLRGRSSGVDLQGRSPSGVDLQGQGAESKSKPPLCSSSKDQDQKQLQVSAECLRLTGFLVDEFNIPNSTWPLMKAMAATAVMRGISLEQAQKHIRQQMQDHGASAYIELIAKESGNLNA
jgi:hypothetical protein